MRAFSLRRRRFEFLLDGVFALLVLHFLLTGAIVPAVLTDLLHHERPVVASSEPQQAPTQLQPIAPETRQTPSPSLQTPRYS